MTSGLTLKFSLLAKTASVAGLFLVAVSASVPAQAQSLEGIVDVNRTFTMELQRNPIKAPTSAEDSRVVTVNCDDLALHPVAKSVIPTMDFIEPFDVGGDYARARQAANTKESGPENLKYKSGLIHIGYDADSNHAQCMGQSELLSGVAKRRKSGGYESTSGTNRTTVPLANDRYCPVTAAIKICTRTTADDAYLSPIWKQVSPNEFILDRTALQQVESPPLPE